LNTNLKYISDFLLKCKRPVVISFSPDNFTDTLYTKHYINAWKYMFEYFNNSGVSNTVWLFPYTIKSLKYCFPGASYVDGFYLGTNIYESKHIVLQRIDEKENKPLFKFNRKYNKSGFKQLSYKKSCLIPIIYVSYFGTHPFSFPFDIINFLISFLENFFYIDFDNMWVQFILYNLHEKKKCKILKRLGNGVYRLYHLNNPFFIKGIAYNIGHDWRDGSKIPSRFQLQKDFSLIKSMGANTIRRYDSDIYDYNIMKYAKENNLMVQFGFWFDPKIDYKNDFLKVQEYINKVRGAVEQHKNNPNILMWSLGNECYGQLKHHFEKPYLINVRYSYLRMLEYMANLIHELDPDRPVVTCVEHEESQLPGELRDLCFYSPSLDAIGINSYYKGQISRLDSVFTSIDTTRPYFISEFGPSGYWNSHYNTYIKNRIIEQNSLEKAGWYAEQWREYVKKNQNRCLGGISYCWQDRMEGSLSLFGITDYENGLKPSYWALKREWNDNCKDTIPYSDEIHLDYKKFDGSMIYTIANNSCLKNSVEIIWKLYDENTFTNYSNYNLSDDNHSIRIFSPNSGKLKLKLSVFIRDQSNNTISASLPVFFD
ncbi:MAG: glycoside hydrolase family 2 TIM barrel-domain containing protein, partial [Bacteroidota bacterium]